ncbi:unnamed protein product [Cuscuta epithymum]|uniref:Meiotic nuclear division protein 1 homolog n=1 Tax=Cuscuta epithymum TaxID=186058 RepID=A0AAV0DWU0_9ASTE|nr:unnamed protein product [Cuscuta epithymum]
MQSKKRGLSLEEKRERMLQIFYDSQDFFLLKELEKSGPKKGVISQSVKDVVQSLVDDDLVSKDKIGTSVYFWSLPSCAGNQLRNVYRKLETELQSSKKRHSELLEHSTNLKKGREESDEREEALEELKATEQKHMELKEELAQYADNDPATIEKMKSAVQVAHAAANRWTGHLPDTRITNFLGKYFYWYKHAVIVQREWTCTKLALIEQMLLGSADSIFTLREWCSNKFPQAKEQLDHLYNEVGITDELDYLELPVAVPHLPGKDQIV